MNAKKITTFVPDAEDFGIPAQSNELVLAPVDEPQPDVPKEAARGEWKADIMAQFTEALGATLDKYRLKYEAALSAKDQRIATLQHTAKDAADKRLKLSIDLQISKAREAQTHDELRAMRGELSAAKKRNRDLAAAAKTHRQQLKVLRSENAALEAQVLQHQRDHSEALQRQAVAYENAQARNQSLELALDSAQNEVEQLKQENSGLLTELKTTRVDHIVRTTSLENKVKSLNDHVFTLEHNAHSQHRRSVQSRNNAAQKEQILFSFRAHYGVAQKQNMDLREASAALATENQVLRTENTQLATAHNLAQQEVRRLQALVPTQPRIAAQVPQVISAAQEARGPGSPSSFGFGIFGSVASSTVSVITGTPRSLFKAVMGSAVVDFDDGFTSPV